ncbi:3-isopropylmalate dehydratase small subunit [Enterovirga aerilata]|uniref:3-isopropylmalate dehydratase small subunit n=1 Tax=Enterovirga aerilata TaxID=2730920 RepID=A0A849I2J8_9HYPH|nr:3-isopropylmalate dehydratase small subunit [Enterovirga sp. DB1703]NNM71578.1 3-isopropylmalate dehydratase small subunit [Enterovirga sp. DB1703]
MEPFIRLTGIAAPIEGRNIDTDQILPARFLKADRAKGYGQYFFHDARFDGEGREKPDFVLNREPFRHATIVVTDDNFGCGSSREGAVYALHDFGVRAVLAPSFGDIFYNNCLKNGVVPVRLERGIVTGLLESLKDAPRPEVTVDLEALEVVLPDGARHAFTLDPFWRECLMKGVDEIQLTLGYLDRIEAFEGGYHREMTWLRPQAGPVP